MTTVASSREFVAGALDAYRSGLPWRNLPQYGNCLRGS
jgi:hypothetical protein